MKKLLNVLHDDNRVSPPSIRTMIRAHSILKAILLPPVTNRADFPRSRRFWSKNIFTTNQSLRPDKNA